MTNILILADVSKTQIAQAAQNLVAGQYVPNYIVVNRPRPSVLTLGMYA